MVVVRRRRALDGEAVNLRFSGGGSVPQSCCASDRERERPRRRVDGTGRWSGNGRGDVTAGERRLRSWRRRLCGCRLLGTSDEFAVHLFLPFAVGLFLPETTLFPLLLLAVLPLLGAFGVLLDEYLDFVSHPGASRFRLFIRPRVVTERLRVGDGLLRLLAAFDHRRLIHGDDVQQEIRVAQEVLDEVEQVEAAVAVVRLLRYLQRKTVPTVSDKLWRQGEASARLYIRRLDRIEPDRSRAPRAACRVSTWLR
jgi:hypothetical protein